MRIIEIILKLAFVFFAIVMFTHIGDAAIMIKFLVVSFLLGLVLLFNKKTSYGTWGSDSRDYVMRRIEGIILIVSAIVGYFLVK